MTTINWQQGWNEFDELWYTINSKSHKPLTLGHLKCSKKTYKFGQDEMLTKL